MWQFTQRRIKFFSIGHTQNDCRICHGILVSLFFYIISIRSSGGIIFVPVCSVITTSTIYIYTVSVNISITKTGFLALSLIHSLKTGGRDNNSAIYYPKHAPCFTQPDYNCLRQCSPRPGQLAMLVITADLINQLRLTGSAEPDRTVTSGSRSTAAKVRVSIVLAPLSSTPLITRRSKVGDLGRDLDSAH